MFPLHLLHVFGNLVNKAPDLFHLQTQVREDRRSEEKMGQHWGLGTAPGQHQARTLQSIGLFTLKLAHTGVPPPRGVHEGDDGEQGLGA